MSSLSIERLRQVLAETGITPGETDQMPDAEEYTWNRPHAFSGNQLKKLEFYSSRLVHSFARRLSLFMQKELEGSIVSTSQSFTDQYLNDLSSDESTSYYISFGKDNNKKAKYEGHSGDLFGFFNIPHKTAITWATELLGETISEEEAARELTNLEESVLSDVGEKLVSVLEKSHNTFRFESSADIKCSSEQILIDWHGTEAFYTVTFSIKEAGSDSEGLQCQILLLCDKLHPVTGGTRNDHEDIPALEMSGELLEHVKQVKVPATVQLASLSLPLDDVLSLQPDDILLLNKSVNEPIELVAYNKTLFYGQPAKSGGRYALVISEPAEE